MKLLERIRRRIVERAAPPVTAESAEAVWHKGGLTSEEWNSRGRELFSDFEEQGVRRGSREAPPRGRRSSPRGR
jgi:hypothetical protein